MKNQSVSKKVKAAPAPAVAAPIHVNKTGRICFSKEAASLLPSGSVHCALSVDVPSGIIRIKPLTAPAVGSLQIRNGGSGYISDTKNLKLFGFDGSLSLDPVSEWQNGEYTLRIADSVIAAKAKAAPAPAVIAAPAPAPKRKATAKAAPAPKRKAA